MNLFETQLANEDTEEKVEESLPSTTTDYVAILGCKYNDQRLRIGDSVPKDWPKKVIEQLLTRKHIVKA